ncbi:MAG: Mrp/NBP35 family ATP-binding protein [Myxococcota bacterium]
MIWQRAPNVTSRRNGSWFVGNIDSAEDRGMENVKNIILVASGKGGVGKSTVSTNLALALSKLGYATGLLDADIYGPSIPTMFGEAQKPGSPDGKRIFPVEKFGLKLMSMGYLVDPNTAMAWRGPMLAGAVMQFVRDVEWGELDYLLFDLPPGTGDIQLSLAQGLKVTGSVLVTTPQKVALADVIRAKAMFDKVRIPTLGMVENMSYFICSNCSERHEIFSYGGGERTAGELGVPFLGRIPIETSIMAAGDSGEPIVSADPDSATSAAFVGIAEALDEIVRKAQSQRAESEQGRGALRIIQ